MIKKQLIKKINTALVNIGINNCEVNLDHPANNKFGDYTTNVSLRYAGKLKKNPLQLAYEIAKKLGHDDLIEKVEVVKPGFINFFLNKEYLINQIQKIVTGKINYPTYYLGTTKKVMVEFAHPNTHKIFHIGHLRNISTGESIVRILEATGNKVIRTNYQGDVGLHIAKCLYKITNHKSQITNLNTLKEKIEFIGKMYMEGSQAYETDAKAKEEILEINRQIYEKDPEIANLWIETRQWSLDYFNGIYKRVYTYFDRFYFESEMAKRGTTIVKELLEKGLLEKSENAIIFNGKKYGLDTRVFINSLGFPTYEGKELALAEKEFGDFGEIDKCLHVVTPEQKSFFKVTFKVEELLDEKKYKNKQYHLVYEWVKLKSGKMASRLGNIIAGEWVLDEVKKKILKTFKCDQTTAEIIAIAAVKYSFLKNSLNSIIAFDFDESISVEGNSAPYLLYTYVRTQSILKKISFDISMIRNIKQIPNLTVEDDYLLLRMVHQYPEIVYNAASNMAPNIIANYLFNLAQQFNLFYEKCPILKADENTKNFRLLLTKAVSQVIKNGLYLLGMKTVEKM